MYEFFIEYHINAAGEDDYSFICEYRTDRQFYSSMVEGYPDAYVKCSSSN